MAHGKELHREACVRCQGSLTSSAAGVRYLMMYSAHSLFLLAFLHNYEDKRIVLLSHLTNDDSGSGKVKPMNDIFGQLILSYHIIILRSQNKSKTIITIGA